MDPNTNQPVSEQPQPQTFRQPIIVGAPSPMGSSVVQNTKRSYKLPLVIAGIFVLFAAAAGAYVLLIKDDTTAKVTNSKPASSNEENVVAKTDPIETKKCLSREDQLIWNDDYDVYSASNPNGPSSFLSEHIDFFKADSSVLEYAIDKQWYDDVTKMILKNKDLSYKMKLRAQILQPNGNATAADKALVEARFLVIKKELTSRGIPEANIDKLEPVIDTKGYKSESARNVKLYYDPGCVYVNDKAEDTTKAYEYTAF